MRGRLLVVHDEPPLVPLVVLHDRRRAHARPHERRRRGLRALRRRGFPNRRRVPALGVGLRQGRVVECLGFVLAGRTFAEGRTIGWGQVEGGAQTVVLLLELGDAHLESLQVCGSSCAKCSLDISRPVRREIVVALATTLGRHRGRCGCVQRSAAE